MLPLWVKLSVVWYLTLAVMVASASVMFGLSVGHLLIVLVVVLLFSSRRLPELGHALGKGIGAFKRGLEGKGLEAQDHQDKDHKNLPPQA